jgi:hypothetical protein
MQVLYFTPQLREAVLQVRPEPEEEFSLLDELTLLFRMLLAGGPVACLATNLLRALRQNRGAAALGLLETHSQRSGENTDIEVVPLSKSCLDTPGRSKHSFDIEVVHAPGKILLEHSWKKHPFASFIRHCWTVLWQSHSGCCRCL